MNRKLVGKFEALLVIMEGRLKELQDRQAAIDSLILRLNFATRNIDDLRPLSAEIRGVLQEYKKPEWISGARMAKELGIAKKSFYRMEREGLFHGYALGDSPNSKRLYDRDEVLAGFKSREKA